jgi:excisionase family DNA binding protein
MKTYTTQEAAELTGSSVRALRKRIERGQLRAVQHGRYWRSPTRSSNALVSLALRGRKGDRGPKASLRCWLCSSASVLSGAGFAQEVARLRPLTAHVERITEDLHRERAERLAAEARAAETANAADELRERERELVTAGFFACRRMIRELRHQTA